MSTEAHEAGGGRHRGRVVAFLQRHDPQGTGWRRGLRAAVVAPAVLGAGLALGSDSLALYALFSAVAHLVFGDYDGPIRRRAATYAATTVIGAVLITVATLVSPVVWLAALATGVVGFALTFLCVLGAGVSMVRIPLLLAFVLAASVSATPSALGARLVGWTVAGVLSLLAALYLVPRPVDLVVRQRSVAACRALAAALEHPGAQSREAAELLDRLADERAARAWRSYGPAGRSRAMVIFVEELEATRDLIGTYAEAEAQDPCADAGRALIEACATVLRASAAAVEGSGPAPDLRALDGARRHHRHEMEAWASSALAAGTAPASVLDRLDAVRALRLLSHVVLTVGAAAVATTSGDLPAVWADSPPRPEAAGSEQPASAVGDTLRSHLALSSVWFRDSVRVAVALAAGVAVARVGDLQNGFWVVLGVISVLRTSVAAAGRSALRALAGTVAGFLAVVPILAVAGDRPLVHWLVLPLAMFVAGYASSALSFAYGQGAFTLFIVLAIDLVEPKGWHAGVVRIEDIVVGCAVALGIGLLFWPRGARREARAALGELYDRLGRLVGGDIGQLLAKAPPAGERATGGTGGTVGAAGTGTVGAAGTGTVGAAGTDGTRGSGGAAGTDGAVVVASLRRARVAVDDLIAERGDATPGVRGSARLLATGAELCFSAERTEAMLANRSAGDGAAVPASTAAALAAEAGVVTAMLCGVGAAVVSSSPLQIPPIDELRQDRRQATIAALAAWAAAGDGDRPADGGASRSRSTDGHHADALTLVWVGQWLVDVADTVGRLVGPVASLAAAGGRSPDAPAPPPSPSDASATAPAAPIRPRRGGR